MPRRAIELTPEGDFARTPDLIEATEVQVTPTANGIPRADAFGKLHVGWMPNDVRTVNVREADGSPSLTDIRTLVVGNGDLTFLGNGEARIRTASDASGGSGGTLTVREHDGSPTVANVTTLVVGAGDLTDLGNGAVRLRTASDASGGGGGDGIGSIGGLLYMWERFV